MSEHANTHRKPRTGLPRGARALALTSATALCASLGMTLAATPAQAAVTLTVTVAGNDANPCSSGAPCKTVQRAVNLAGQYAESQDVTINVGAGTFAEAAGVVVNYVGTNPKPLSLTIVGAGADRTTVQPAIATRVFGIVGDFPVVLKAMTITGGLVGTGATGTAGQPGAAGLPGGGVYKAVGSGSLTLADVAITNNSAGAGGAGFNGTNGPIGSGIPGNGGVGVAGTNGGPGGSGGGVAYLGTGALTITGSTISGNKAGFGGSGGTGGNGGQGDTVGDDGKGGNGAPGGNGGAGGAGGGIAFAGTALTITNSTIVTNVSGKGGNGGNGGAGGRGGDATPENIGGNGALGGNGGNGGAGGGIELLTGAVSAILTHVTLAANSVHVGGSLGTGGAAGAGVPATATPGANGNGGLLQTSSGLHRTAGTVTLANSLLSNSPANCSNTAGNLVATNSVAGEDSCFAAASGLLVSDAAGNLSGLALNGGTTPTAAPVAGNPAIGAIPAVACAPKDQRGQTRPGLTAPDTCTAGAFEPQVPPVAPTITGAISAVNGKTKYGWYRDTVTVTFTCTPGSSALTAPCPAPMVISTQGANQGGTVTITNQQGLTSSIKVALNIDKGLPNVAVKGVKKGQLYNKAKKVTCVATDSLSGPYLCQVTATGKLVKGNTQVRVNYKATAVDRAGNTRTKSGHYFFKRSA